MHAKKFFAFTFLFLTACATVPYTHRHQFNLVSIDDEIKLGEDAYAQVLKENKLSNNTESQRRLKDIGAHIKEAAIRLFPDDASKFQWEFNVLQGNQVNAFCLPGGKVAFWEAIMPICGDDNGIAVVMGHEVSHALAHHGAERMTQSMGVNIIGEIVSIGLGNADPGVRDGALQAFGIGTNLGLLKFSRTDESEADHIGLILMAEAGYDPRAAVDFWRRMTESAKGKKPPEFLSTHPSDETRIEQIEAWLPEALSHYKQP